MKSSQPQVSYLCKNEKRFPIEKNMLDNFKLRNAFISGSDPIKALYIRFNSRSPLFILLFVSLGYQGYPQSKHFRIPIIINTVLLNFPKLSEKRNIFRPKLL